MPTRPEEQNCEAKTSSDAEYLLNECLHLTAPLGGDVLSRDYCIMRIDSQFLHSEVIVLALQFLSGQEYAVANEDFRQAHKEYVDGNYDDCIHDCCNSFESVLKIILAKKN
ncbi:hypothetical protein [Sphingomonas sp. Leaf242]|uniref:hypothetical protein n=1 Tax=Sphingomonas sp. Leaf242 TaxID=1736304 RepID=UPI000B0400E6|nr:hypothetical protein [Sphingomonas sp. Leaf242]